MAIKQKYFPLDQKYAFDKNQEGIMSNDGGLSSLSAFLVLVYEVMLQPVMLGLSLGHVTQGLHLAQPGLGTVPTSLPSETS